MGWGPVDWVERVLPEAKLKNTTTLLFEIFRFERPIPRYLLKTVLPCKALGFSYGLITAVLCTWGAQGGKLELEHMLRFLHIEGGVSAFRGIISIRMQTQQKCDKACAKHLSTMQQHTEIKVIQS